MFEKYEKITALFKKPIPLNLYYQHACAYRIPKKQAWYALQIAKRDGHITLLRKPGISVTILPNGYKTKIAGK